MTLKLSPPGRGAATRGGTAAAARRGAPERRAWGPRASAQRSRRPPQRGRSASSARTQGTGATDWGCALLGTPAHPPTHPPHPPAPTPPPLSPTARRASVRALCGKQLSERVLVTRAPITGATARARRRRGKRQRRANRAPRDARRGARRRGARSRGSVGLRLLRASAAPRHAQQPVGAAGGRGGALPGGRGRGQALRCAARSSGGAAASATARHGVPQLRAERRQPGALRHDGRQPRIQVVRGRSAR